MSRRNVYPGLVIDTVVQTAFIVVAAVILIPVFGDTPIRGLIGLTVFGAGVTLSARRFWERRTVRRLIDNGIIKEARP